jgi:archaetidylinositol phosphate synthase
MATEIDKHRRVNDILLGPLERPALRWLAAHMPAWVTPDICTLIGILGALVILVSYILSNFDPGFLWLASLGFVINWFGDSMDGTLARYRHIERPRFGFFIDHTVDIITEAMIILGLGLTPFISFNMATLTLIAYYMLSLVTMIRTCVVGEFKISYGKLGPTEVRVLAILLNTAMYFGGVQVINWSSGIFGQPAFSAYDLIVSVITLLLLYFFFVTAIRETISLAKAGL